MRKVEPDIIRGIEAATIDSEDFHLSVKNKAWRSLIVFSAAPWDGVKEYTNKNDGNYIEMSGLTVDRKHNGEAYCMAWVQTIIAYVEYKLKITSPLKATEGCLDLWNSTSKAYKTSDYPLPGYIAVWQHGTSPAGHAGIVLKVTDTYFKCIEANSVGPDGVTQGIFTHERLFSGDGKMRLLGFISPF